MNALDQTVSTDVDLSVHALKGGKKKRILLVEGDRPTRSVLLDKFQTAGLEVVIASDGSSARREMQAGPLDAIITELKLRDTDGIDLIDEFRRVEALSTRPIYVFTCTALMSERAWSEAGSRANRLFNKLTTAVDDVVAEVPSDLIGIDPGENPVDTRPPQVTDSNTGRALSDRFEATASRIGRRLRCLAQGTAPDALAAKCKVLSGNLRSLTSRAAIAGYCDLARESAALEALTDEIHQQPERATESRIRALADGAELLTLLARASSAGPQRKPSKITVIVVHEGPAACMEISHALVNAACVPVCFTDPAHALRQLETSPANLIVLDVLDPNSRGIDFCRRIRGIPLHETTPMVLITNPAQSMGLPSTADIGPIEYVVKPLSHPELILKTLGLTRRFIGADSGVVVVPATGGAMEAAPAARGEAAGEGGGDSSSDTGFVMLDEWGQIVSAHPSCTTLFEWRCEDLVGQSLEALLAAPLGEDLEQFLRRQESAPPGGQKAASQTVARRKCGTEFAAALSLRRLSGNPRFCIAAFQDIKTDPPIHLDATADSPKAPEPPATLVLDQTVSKREQALVDIPELFQQSPPSRESQRSGFVPSMSASERPEEKTYSFENEAAALRARLERESENRKQLEERLQDLATVNEDLVLQLTEQRRGKAQLSKIASELRTHMAVSDNVTGQAEAVLREKVDSCNRLERQSTDLRKAMEQLNRKLEEEQRAAAESRHRTRELEDRLRQSTDDSDRRFRETATVLARAQAGLEEERTNRQHIQRRAEVLAAKLQQSQAELRQSLESRRAKQNMVVVLKQKLREQADTIARVNSHLQRETRQRQAAENQLRAAEARNARLEMELPLFQPPGRTSENPWPGYFPAQQSPG